MKKLSVIPLSKNTPTVHQLSEQTGRPLAITAGILRNFFIDFHPGSRKYISNIFQISHIADENAEISYRDIENQLPMKKVAFGTTADDMMTHMEITLYPEWNEFVRRLEKNFLNPTTNIEKIRTNVSLKNQLSFFKDVTLLLIIGFVIIVIIQQGNKVYEKYLRDKISIYGPQIQWTNESLYFKETK